MKKLWTTIAVVTAIMCAAISSTQCVEADAAKAAAPAAQVRTVSFRVNEACSCAQCSFEAYHVLKKFEGVQKVSLDVGARRLDIAFSEGKSSVSDLAHTLEKLDVGKDSALLWPLAKGTDAQQLSTRLAQVAGVSSAKIEKKSGLVAVKFDAKSTVSWAQLDEAAARRGDT